MWGFLSGARGGDAQGGWGLGDGFFGVGWMGVGLDWMDWIGLDAKDTFVLEEDGKMGIWRFMGGMG